MSVLDRKYMLRLDLSKQKNNTEMEFSISDNQTSDFSVKITHKGKPVDLTDVLGLLVVTKPSGKVDIAQGQIIETSSVYFNLQNNCKDEVGIYSAYVVLGHTYQDIIDDKDRVLLGQITYVVNNDTVQELQPLIPGDDNFQIMIDIITRLQELESNENARILAEQLRVQAEQARVAEHNSMIETFDTKVQEVESTIASVVATEQGIKEAEAIRVTSENTRINNETDRQHAETDRVVAEKKRVVEHDSMMDSTTVAIANINSTDASIKEAESKRVLAEQDRVDAENIREQAIEKVKTDIVKLINDTNKKIDDYKLEKDTAIQQDLEEYKSTTTQDIQDYKVSKDTEINKSLSDYKTSTTQDVEDYKNTKNAEIDKYKSDKDLEIDNYISSKNAELDKYVTTKNTEIDNYKNSKDTLINNKLEEVDTAEQSRVEAEQQRVTEHADREAFLNSFESQLGQIETKNVEQDARIDKVEYNNKVQDVYINGLFNENADGRLSITGEGNSVKLEHSKEGLVEVDKVVGETLVNLCSFNNFPFILQGSGGQTIIKDSFRITDSTKTYTIVMDLTDVNNVDNKSIFLDFGGGLGTPSYAFKPVQNQRYIITITGIISTADLWIYIMSTDNLSVTVNNLIILEGDYTNKPIPAEYFEGMQSTFEDKIVTQEMVDAGEESVENLGKYKVELKTRGKNLLNLKTINNTLKGVTFKYNSATDSVDIIGTSTDDYAGSTTILIDAQVGKTYKLSVIGEDTSKGIIGVLCYTKEGTTQYYDEVVWTEACSDLRFYIQVNRAGTVCNNSIKAQIEEVATITSPATEYEPYKEHKTSILLPEPLYMNNELCVYEGRLGYWKNSEKVVLDGSEDEKFSDGNNSDSMSTYMARYVPYSSCGTNVVCDKFKLLINGIWTNDIEGIYAYKPSNCIDIRINKSKLSTYDLAGFKTWLQANPTTVIYELAEPIFVPILENTPQWILDSYNSCTVHFETNVPILSSSFKYTGGIPSVMVMDRSISDLMYSFAYISKALNILGGEEV